MYFLIHYLKEQYHGLVVQNVYKWRKCSLNLWNNNVKNSNLMIESNFVKEFRIATAFLQNFQAELEYLKKVHPEQFSKFIL